MYRAELERASLHELRRKSSTPSLGSPQTSLQEHPLCYVGDLSNGEKREFSVDEGSVLLIRHKSKFYALGSKCAHCGERLSSGLLIRGKIRCSNFGTAYNIRTGYLEDFPGLDNIQTHTVQVRNDTVFLMTTREKILAERALPVMTKCRNFVNDPVVIIGTGISALTCAETLRQEGFRDRIVMITREDTLPYDRTKLSKTTEVEPKSLLLRPGEFFENYDIEVMLNTRVKSLNTEEKVVCLEDGASVQYSNLVLAMGSVPAKLNVKGADLEGVKYLRTLDDALDLYESMKRKHIAVLGSNLLGLELASSIGKQSRSVSIFGKGAAPLTMLPTQVGQVVREFAQAETLFLRQNSLVKAVEGFDKVGHMVLKDGLCAVAHIVVPAIGVRPCSSLLLGSSVSTNSHGFVVVDSQMRTSARHVFAVGDLTSFPLTAFNGNMVNCDHWYSAQFQGRKAAFAIVSQKEMSVPLVPFFWTVFLDRTLTFAGDLSCVTDERILRGSLKDNDFVCYCIKNDEVVAVVNAGTRNAAIQFLEMTQHKIKIKKQDVVKNISDNWITYPSTRTLLE
ncbi:hypothetical protein QR680_005336 [Steinernema hermaphroditum]|uniref:Rieske domain-containing protein n=1 Tax=Steinernema hermaphroditum TaxID=289476 RepID=A0AA39HRM6_9BILA|nr:hypothetical protein QR680_005336 [Steinernema hermaphroditum]